MMGTLAPHWSQRASLYMWRSANTEQSIMHAQRSPHTRLSPFHQFLELFVVLIVNTEQCLFCLQQLPRYFPHLDLTSQSICPDYFCRNKAISLRILKKYIGVLSLNITFVDIF